MPIFNDTDSNHKTRWPQLLAGFKGVTPADLPREIAAGVTLAALIIPLNIGFAQVAGLSPVTGLYTAIIPLLVFALVTGSRNVVGSPDASIAALMGATLVAFAAPGDPLRLQYALAMAVMCAVLFFVFWWFRLAFLANFLSRAVMVGFISGLAIEVFTNQVRRILEVSHETGAGSEVMVVAEQIRDVMATSVETTGYFLEMVALVESIPHANLYSLAIGLGALIIVRLIKRYAPRLPGALIALILLTVIVAVFNLDDKGVGVLGAIPSAAPTLTRPDIPLSDYLRLLPGAMAVVCITLCEAMLLVRRYCRKHGYEADGDQELFAYGVANITAGLTGSLIFGNSPSRSAAMDSSGARSQLPSVVAACVIALVMFFFTDQLAFLPNAALAGIVANAVLSLIEVRDLKEFWHIRRSEFWIALVCLVSVLVLGPLRAVIVAFLLSTIDVVRRASSPRTSVLRRTADGSHLVPGDSSRAATTSGLIVYRFEAPLYFANANVFREQIEQLLARSATPVRRFVLDAQAIVDIDTSGAEALKQTLDLLAGRGVAFGLSRVSEQVMSLLDQYELLHRDRETGVYATNREAVAAFHRESEGSLKDQSP